MMHGSTNRTLELLKPIRFSSDRREFGNQAAVYATQDPLWGLFFALLDREATDGPISSGAIRLKGDDGSVIRRYFFTVEIESLKKFPWIQGAVYILPRANAEPDPDFASLRYGQYTLEVTHWPYRGEVQLVAKMLVEPEDFPFLDCVWGCDAQVLSRRMEADSIAGWPFLDDSELYPILPDKRLSIAFIFPAQFVCLPSR